MIDNVIWNYQLMDNCTIDCIELKGNFSFTQTCEVAQQLCVQDTVQFIQGYYCFFNQSFFLLMIIGLTVIAVLYKAMDTLASNYLTPCVQDFITKFKISHKFAGVTFLAFANGAPDVLTAIVAGGSDSGSTVLIPFGSIFGALLFSSTIILSTVIFILNHQLKVNKVQILQPVIFYVIGIVYIIGVSIFYQRMNWYLCSGLFILYFIYIILVIKSQKKFRKRSLSQKKSQRDSNSNQENTSDIDKLSDPSIGMNISQSVSTQKDVLEANKQQQASSQTESELAKYLAKIYKLVFDYSIPPFDPQTWHPLKATVSLIISPVIIAVAQGPHTIVEQLSGIPIILLISVPSCAFLIHTIYLLFSGSKPKNMVAYSLYAFIVSIAWLTLVCSVLINIIELFQLLTGINAVFLGLTLFAWANSIGDYLSITSFAAKGHASTAIAGVFSGQLFNFLVGFGGSLLVQSLDGQFEFDLFNLSGSVFEILSDSIVILVMVSGLIYLCIITYKVIKNQGAFVKQDAILSRIFYVIFLIVAIMLSISTDFFREIVCDIQAF